MLVAPVLFFLQIAKFAAPVLSISLLTNSVPTLIDEPVPVVLNFLFASLTVAYIGAVTVVQSCVALLKYLRTQLEPLDGVVVLTHVLPVGVEPVNAG